MKVRNTEKEGPIPESVGERIRGLRTDKGLTLEAFGKLVHDNKNSISLIELGKQDINIEKLKEYAKALDTTAYYLLTGTKDKNAFVTEDLGLSDESIETLRSSKDYYRYIGLTSEHQQEIVRKYGIKNYMPVQDTINLLLSHFDLVMLLHNYFFDELNEILYEPVEDAGMASISVSSIRNFPMEDFESPVRIQIMDELKKLRDATKKKKRIVSGMI